MTRTHGSPARSSRAFVATVVPRRTTAIRSAGMLSSVATPSRYRMPATAGSSYPPGFSDSSLCTASAPSGRRATTSVNVPPRSIQNSQRPSMRLASPICLASPIACECEFGVVLGCREEWPNPAGDADAGAAGGSLMAMILAKVWGAGGDGGVDGDLVVLFVVDQFQAERCE